MSPKLILEGRIPVGPNSRRYDLIAIYADGTILGQACFPGMVRSSWGDNGDLVVLPGETLLQAGRRYLKEIGAEIHELKG